MLLRVLMVALSIASWCSAQTTPLTFRPLAAEFSSGLDRIIMVSANPSQLHIFDPASGTDKKVDLSKVPISLSVSPDGTHAAVGHDLLVSYVNLNTAAVEQT